MKSVAMILTSLSSNLRSYTYYPTLLTSSSINIHE
ncbi:hypothetical protein MGSAQ_000985 [marine sediment metagenome]|uniref:Uncharacterized protein n=1 Tax=marine sediment metagenome TaxID=412755 RepID=A0A1B6NVN6_9ZZZZ